jgi:hypothetical protein
VTRRERDLRRIAGVERITMTGGNHLRLHLINGARIYTSLTPSDRRVMKQVLAQVKRALRQERRA